MKILRPLARLAAEPRFSRRLWEGLGWALLAAALAWSWSQSSSTPFIVCALGWMGLNSARTFWILLSDPRPAAPGRALFKRIVSGPAFMAAAFVCAVVCLVGAGVALVSGELRGLEAFGMVLGYALLAAGYGAHREISKIPAAAIDDCEEAVGAEAARRRLARLEERELLESTPPATASDSSKAPGKRL